MKKLTKDEMKKIMGGVEDPIECSISVTCPNGGTVSCSSHGASGNPQGGNSCQKVEGLFVNCYDTGAPNNWNYKQC